MTARIGQLTITYDIADDGETVTEVTAEGDMPIVVQLGLLRLAEDTLLREAMGE